MPRLTTALPKYRKHRASGQAIVTLGGKDFYLGPHGTRASRHEYDRLIGEWTANGRCLPDDHQAVTIVDLIAAYRRHAESYYVKNGKPTDELSCIKSALRTLRQSYGQQPVDAFSALKLEVVREKMIDKGNSRGYINKQMQRIKRTFRWGVSKRLVPANVYQSIATLDGLRKGRCAARETDPVLPVASDLLEATMRHLPPVVAGMVQLQRLTGMRPEELCAMRPGDIDRSGDIWAYVPARHKMEHLERTRTIFIGPRSQAILAPYLLRPADEMCFQPRRRGSSFYTTRSYRNAIHLACDKAFPAPAGISTTETRQWRSQHRWSPNQLRHSAATEIRRRFGLEAAQVTLGHAKADVTQVYAERDMEKAAAIMREVG